MTYQIEEVAEKTGLTKRALRYYEDIGLINPIRTDSGYRLYSEDDIEKIMQVAELKRSLGFSLKEIKGILALKNDLNKILNGEDQNAEFIESSIVLVRDQIEKVEKNLNTLIRLKGKYDIVLSKLISLNKDITGGNKID